MLPRLEVLAEAQVTDLSLSLGGEAVRLIIQQISTATLRIKFESLAKTPVAQTVVTNDSLVQQEWSGSRTAAMASQMRSPGADFDR